MATHTLHICVSNQSYQIIEIVTIIMTVIAVVTSCGIIFHAMKQLPKQTKIKNIFKVLFYASASFTVLTVVTAGAATILCVEGEERWSLASASCSLCSYFLLLFSLLTTLLLRLYHTFHGSSYEVPKCKQIIMWILYILFLLCATAAVAMFILLVYKSYNNSNFVGSHAYVIFNWICVTLACLAGIIYLFQSAWACYIFVNKLMLIANLGASSMISLKANSENENDKITAYSLNTKQTKLINSISKYVNLFCLATIGSIIVIIVLSGRKWFAKNDQHRLHAQIYLIMSSIDALVNLICLYLQYQFNTFYYMKYCEFLERCWKRYFIKRAQKSMYATATKEEQNQLTPLKVYSEELDGDNMETNT
eukprot:311146_1